jgi:hypothetical protein
MIRPDLHAVSNDNWIDKALLFTVGVYPCFDPYSIKYSEDSDPALVFVVSGRPPLEIIAKALKNFLWINGFFFSIYQIIRTNSPGGNQS